MQTVEAVIESTGAVRLLGEVKLSKSRRALVTILDEEPIDAPELSSNQKKDKLIAAFKKAQELNIFREIDDPVEWQRKLRDEWD
ncbi:MAG: hypothetical protein IT173_11255 [Acidobacteria bacterium]|nr:hypothetical protein [Acidobacteriota bacterium]